MTSRQITLHCYDSANTFAQAVADRLAQELQRGLAARRLASFAVPGGTTPGPIFDELAKRELDWSKITVTLTDERWVPATDPASNEALLRSRLLTGVAEKMRVIGLYEDGMKPSASIATVSDRLKKLTLPFDVVLLGMGGDGHFASLFPGVEMLKAGLSLTTTVPCVASDQPINGQPRISLTLQLLLQSRVILLALCGKDKLKVIERAYSASSIDLPVAALLAQNRVPVEIHYTD